MEKAEFIKRNYIIADARPERILESAFGPTFTAYRSAFSLAEAGLRPAAPLHLDVDVTTACNLHCPMCPAGNTRHKLPGFKRGLFLDQTLYQAALAEASGFNLPALRLGLTGEPLLVPDIEDWVREARDAGIMDVSLITNGQILTAEKSRRLIEAGLARLMISVDAAGPETYQKMRPGGDWDTLLHNMEAFLQYRREARRAWPLLRVSFVITVLNQDEAEAFQDLFASRADYLTYQNYLNILGRPETDYGVDASRKLQGRCSEPFTRLALLVDGGLFPCCSDFGRDHPLGYFPERSLLEVWNSAEAQALGQPEAAQTAPCRLCLERS